MADKQETMVSDEVTDEVIQPKKIYGKIELQLDQCLLPDSLLMETPSQIDGLSKSEEMDLRILGCEMIQVSGILLKLPQVIMLNSYVLALIVYFHTK